MAAILAAVPVRAALLIGTAIGLLLGLGGYTFSYARGASSLTGDPAACANCHVMQGQYDHHVRSPLLSVNRSCQTCHRWSEDDLRARVYTIQDRTYQMRNTAMDALLALIDDIVAAPGRGVPAAALARARDEQRQAQSLLDFIEAENSMGFHAPQESMRVLAISIEHTRRGQAALRDGPADTPSLEPPRPERQY